MAGIKFADLAERFIGALEIAGANVLVLSRMDARPLILSVVAGDISYRLEVYLWAITFGGKGRGRPLERRIQLTGVREFTLKAGVRTILGGWSEEIGVFSFWDVRRHLGFTAGSPSLQISLTTLERAGVIGVATESRNVREGTEVAVSVQTDFLLWYVQEYERLYDCVVEVPDVSALVSGQPEDERVFIDSGANDAAQSRRHQVVAVVRTFREARFRPLVLRAYGYRCCLTDVALRLVDAAHIIPVSDPTSTDEPRNGVALSPTLHRAYDCGLLGLLPGGRTQLNKRMIDHLQKQKLDSGIQKLRGMIPPTMRMATISETRPLDEYFVRGLKSRGWTDAEISEANQ